MQKFKLKGIAIAVIMILFLDSCKKQVPINNEDPCFITKVTTNSSSWEYVYNNQNLIISKKSSDGIIDVTYEYNSDDKVIKSYQDSTQTSYILYIYNSTGQLERTTRYYQNDVVGHTEYFYNDKGYLIKSDNYQANGEKFSGNEYVYDSVGNVLRDIYHDFNSNNGQTYEKRYTYGNKKNPYINVSIPKTGEMIGKNNYLTVTSLNYMLESDTIFIGTYQYEYFFNAKDYPTIRTNNGEDYALFEYKTE